MGFTAQATYIDYHTRLYRKSFEMDATDLATLMTDWSTVEAAYDGVTEGALRRVSASTKIDSGNLAPTEGANRDVGATFLGQDSNGDPVIVKVPGFDASFADTYGNIDLTDVTVAAFLALFEAAGPCTASDGQKVDVWIKGTLDK